MYSQAKTILRAGAIAALAGCTGTSNTATRPPPDYGTSLSRLPLGHNAGEEAAAFIQHGADLAHGGLRIISAGNLHLMIGPDATLTRTAQSNTVFSHGHTRTFPANATIVDGGSYRVFTALRT